MKRRNMYYQWAWPFVIILILACGLPSSQPTLPTAPVIPLETIIVQTAAAAQTQTASAAPSATLTPTFLASRTPSKTPTPATSTPTFILIIFTETPLVSPTATQQLAVSGGSGGAGRTVVPTEGSNAEKFKTPQPWACTVLAKSPGNGFIVDPKAGFTVSWTVLNKGTKSWTANTVDFVYQSGYRTEGRKIQDLAGTVAPGGKVTLKLSIVAPKQAGSYNVIWTLKVGSNDFCHMKTTFEVRKK